MNILITGIRGFIGSNFIRALRDKHTLYGLNIIFPCRGGVSQTFFWWDIEPASSPFQTLPRSDTIIHLAGKAHDIRNQSVAQSYFDINTDLIRKIFDFSLKSSAKKFILFSSTKATTDSIVGDMFTEDVVPTPVGAYGKSKTKAGEYIKEHSEYLITEKQVHILRLCMIHGPGNGGNLNLLCNVVKKGIPRSLGDFDNRRSSTSIDSLCYVIEGLLNQDILTGIYYMGNDEALSTDELTTTMYETMEKRSRIWKMNRRSMEGYAGLGTLLHLPLNTGRFHKLTESCVIDSAKIKAVLGIGKLPTTAKEGLMKAIRSFKETK